MSWWANSIEEHFPPSTIFKRDKEITDSELFRFTQIILTEGIPFACAKFPMAYEFAREKAAQILGIHPKQLSLVGSARIGYSLAEEKFGKPFDLKQSDIDLFAVSEELFFLIREEHEFFLNAWQRGEVQPRHEIQRRLWEANSQIDPANSRRGFLDASHIPTLDQFPIAQKCGDAAYKFHVNLESVTGKRIGRRSTIRIYKDWDAAVHQITFTLKGNLERLGFVVGSKATAQKSAREIKGATN